MIFRLFLFYILSCTLAACVSKTEKTAPSERDCPEIKLDVLDTLTALDQLKQKWVYSYSFTTDSCFVLESKYLPYEYHFFECNAPSPEDPLSKTSLNFKSPAFKNICFQNFDKNGNPLDSVSYTFTRFHNNLDIIYFGQYTKGIFYARAVSKDTLVTELTNAFPDRNGKYLHRPGHVYLRKPE